MLTWTILCNLSQTKWNHNYVGQGHFSERERERERERPMAFWYLNTLSTLPLNWTWYWLRQRNKSRHTFRPIPALPWLWQAVPWPLSMFPTQSSENKSRSNHVYCSGQCPRKKQVGHAFLFLLCAYSCRHPAKTLRRAVYTQLTIPRKTSLLTERPF